MSAVLIIDHRLRLAVGAGKEMWHAGGKSRVEAGVSRQGTDPIHYSSE